MSTEIARCYVRGAGLVSLVRMGECRYDVIGEDEIGCAPSSFDNLIDALKRFNEIIYNACI